MKQASETDRQGFFKRAVFLRERRSQPGTYIVPAGVVDIAPPLGTGKYKLINGEWQLQVEKATTLTPLQALEILDRSGLLQSVYDYMQLETTPLVVKLAFQSATKWERNSLLVMNTAILLGLTEEQIDQMFEEGSKIVV